MFSCSFFLFTTPHLQVFLPAYAMLLFGFVLLAVLLKKKQRNSYFILSLFGSLELFGLLDISSLFIS